MEHLGPMLLPHTLADVLGINIQYNKGCDGAVYVISTLLGIFPSYYEDTLPRFCTLYVVAKVSYAVDVCFYTQLIL
jgi:hypothetical protein